MAQPSGVGPPDHPLLANPEIAAALELYGLWVEDQRAALRQPGVAIGLVVGPDLVWARGFGVADLATGRPATPDTVFGLGSITKTFTATALLQLRDAGRLRLDDPVARHLPWFQVQAPAPDEEVITVRHLLTHTAGLPREAPFPYWTDRAFPSRDELVRAIREQVAGDVPGTRYRYSNLGIAVAGMVVEAASGMAWGDYVRRHVLAPLGMESTFVDFASVPPERFATGYLTRPDEGAPPPVAPATEAAALAPAASMASTVRDLARYLSAHAAGSTAPGAGAPLLRATTRREMQRVHWLSESWSSGRGLGWSVWRQSDRTLVGHGGWVAGHRAQIAFEPKTGIGVVVLTNSDEGGPGSYGSTAFELVAPAIEKALAPPEPERPEVELARFTGGYHTPWGERRHLLLWQGDLALYDRTRPPGDDPADELTRLIPEGATAFRIDGDGGDGDTVVFELGEDGRVERMKVGETYWFPEGCGDIGPDLRCRWN
ncbi:MAG TPA: serine hydrolase domain-containing protein [Thermoanaerobaculia bacterium]|nr:serine hydrolase domain-containing protein [Thermoanaerobaculia bacterium]